MRIIDIFLVYQFIRRLATPFDKWDAFRLGIIDKDGNVLRKQKELTTSDERKAFGYFDILVLNLKKLLEKIPGGRSRLASYAAALFLIREGREFEGVELSEEMIEQGLQHYMDLLEDIPTNAAGSGAIAGIGAGPDGEPGFTSKQQKRHRRNTKILKRKPIEEVFDKPKRFIVDVSTPKKFMASVGKIKFLAIYNEMSTHWDVQFTVSGAVDKTGKGDQIKVMSTVVAMFKRFIKDQKPDHINFDAVKGKYESNSRASLYARMLEKFAKDHGYIIAKSSISGGGTKFILGKKDLYEEIEILKRNFIEEAFDKPEPYTITRQTKNSFIAKFKAGKDDMLFSATYDDGLGYWEVQFNANDDIYYNLTNSKHPLRVLSTVVELLKVFVKKYDPDKIQFSGRKDSDRGRASLYSRMVNRFANANGYHIDTKEYKNFVNFILRKMN